jgi:hypothetical protein
MDLYIRSAIRLHGAVLRVKGTTLPFYLLTFVVHGQVSRYFKFKLHFCHHDLIESKSTKTNLVTNLDFVTLRSLILRFFFTLQRQAFYKIGTRSCFPDIKAAGA